VSLRPPPSAPPPNVSSSSGWLAAPRAEVSRRALLKGRVSELRELDAALMDVQTRGVARTVTVLGAAGIGKTRLVRDFLGNVGRAMKDGGPRVFRGNSPEQGAAYAVFARSLRARFGIVEGMDAEAAKAQVRAQVAGVLEDRKVGDVVYFLGQILNLEFVDSPLIKAIEGDAQQLHLLRRSIIKRFLEADAGSPSASALASGVKGGPIVLVLDDLHSAHDDSLDLLAYLIESLHAPILLVCIGRPELVARRDGWARHGGASHQIIELSPLSETDAAAVMHDLLAPCGEEEAVLDLVDAACTLAGGNPALLERMVRIFLDMGVLENVDEFAEKDVWKIHVDLLAHVRLPLTVEDAVHARIAALTSEERIVLEGAASMGSVFWLGGLLAIRRLEVATPEVWASGETRDLRELRAILVELTDRDYVLRLPDSTFAGDEEYVFKHNLEREQLLKLVPGAQQRRCHEALAEWLVFRDNVRTHEENLGMLARHQEQANLRSRAASSYLEAADVARAHYANAKAAEYYDKGLTLVRDGAEVATEAYLSALHHHGDVLQVLGRSADALIAFREMLTRAFRLDLRGKGGAAHSRIGRLHREQGDLADATLHLEAALKLFEEAGDQRGIASAVDDIGKLHWLRGDYPRALEFTQKGLVMRRVIGDRRSIALSLNNLGLVYQDSGQFRLALDAFEQALRIRREIGDLVGVSISLNNLGTVSQDQRDDKRALALFEEAYEVAKETGDRNRIALVLTNLGETHNRLGDAQKAIQYLKEAEQLADELGDKMGLAEAVRGLGKAYLSRLEYTKARECTARAVQLFTEIQSKVQLGVALRSLGEVVAAGSARGGEELRAARGHLLRSVAIFEEIGNEVELARSCRSYAETLKHAVDLAEDPELAREAESFARRADEISRKLKDSSSGIDPEALFSK
jgi:tetratricopeptide (TPR) repeat protein